MDTGKKRKPRTLEMSKEAQASMDALPPEQRTEVFRMLMAILEDPSIGTPVTPQTCPHPGEYVKEAKCDLCGGDVAQA